jgi:hypothetical protein
MRVRRALWPGLVIVAWVAAVWITAASSSNASTWAVVAFVVALTVLAGGLVGGWWAVAVPYAVILLGFAASFVLDPHCHNCGDDSRWGDFVFTLAFVAFPASLAMALGVGVRKLIHRPRSSDRVGPA